MKRSLIKRQNPFQRLVGLALAFAAISALSTAPALAGKGGKGKPGGGGDDPPPPPPNNSTVEYELTWLAGFGGTDTEVHDVNALGIAVGRSRDAAGTWNAFWATTTDGMTALDGWWDLPVGYEGWSMRGRDFQISDFQINEANQVSGFIGNDATSEVELFIADLFDPASLEPLGSVSSNAQWLQMNENGDIAFMSGGSTGGGFRPLLYVRSVDQLFEFQDLLGHYPTALNDNHQLALLTWRDDGKNGYDGAARYSFDPLTETGVLEDFGSKLNDGSLKIAREISNAGTIYGFYEDGRKAKAGLVAAGSLTWNELDSALPTGGTISAFKHGTTFTVAASPVAMNEAGQVLGRYDVRSVFAGSDLWLKDPVEGLLVVDDLVVGDAAEVATFRTWEGFKNVEISEVEPVTEFGIIAGTVREEDNFNLPSQGFILTPKPKP